MASSPITSRQIDGETMEWWETLFGGLQNHCTWWLQPWNSKTLAPWKKTYDQPRQHIKKQSHYFANKGLSSQSYGFSSSHVWMWEVDYRESWALKNWCFWTVVLEKTLESPLDCKEIQPIYSEGDQPWVFFGRKVMTKLDSILKSRNITLPTRVPPVKVMVFPVVMYGCENWTIKKAECRRIDAYELWCWRRLLRVPWTARRSNQSILEEISPEHSLEGLTLKLNSNILATWCEELTHWKRL